MIIIDSMMSMTHSELVNQLLVKLTFTGCRVWKNHVGFDEERKIHYGLVGSSDIFGIMKCYSEKGIWLAVECKVGRDKLRNEQIKFKAMIENHGGLYIEARNIDETFDKVKTFMQSN